MKGVIFFSASDSFISKAIRWFRQSTVSHTGIIINRGKRKLVLEAGWRQVHITTYDKHYKKGYIELYKPLVSEEVIDAAIDKVISNHLEKPYGYFQILGFAVVSLLKRVGIKIKNPFTKGSICSEVSLDYGSGLELGDEVQKEFAKLDPDTTAPDDLLKIIQKSDRFKRIERKHESNTDQENEGQPEDSKN